MNENNIISGTSTSVETVYVSFSFIKTDVKLTKVLSGAEFTMYACPFDENAEHRHNLDVSSTDFCYTQFVASDVSGNDGIINFDDLKTDKQYLLVETKAPEGYDVPKSGWLITLANDGKPTIKPMNEDCPPPAFAHKTFNETEAYYCVNNRVNDLPFSSGIGPIGIVLLGTALMILSLAMFAIFRKKSKRAHKKSDANYN